MSRKKLSRRQFVAATALTSAALVTAPYVRGAYAAGKLTMGFWDHWVPGANDTCTALINGWAAKEKVEATVDYITTQGNKNLVTIAAESAAQSGHDILAMPIWWPHANSDMLEPVNDNSLVDELLASLAQGRRVRRTLDLKSGETVLEPDDGADALCVDEQKLVSFHGPRWRLRRSPAARPCRRRHRNHGLRRLELSPGRQDRPPPCAWRA